jgi:hypothetical protein
MKLLLAQGEDLAAHKARDARPAQKAQNQHHVDQAYRGVHPHAVHDRADDDQKRQRGNAVEDIHKRMMSWCRSSGRNSRRRRPK